MDPTGLAAEEPQTYSYTPDPGTGFYAAARFVMQQSGIEDQSLLREISDGIQLSFEMQGMSLQAGETYELYDAGMYVPGLASNNVSENLRYFVIHDTGILGESLSKYEEPARRKRFHGTVHGFIDPKGEFLQTTPFGEVAIGTKMERDRRKGIGEMVHIELLLPRDETPTRAQYERLAAIYNELTGGQASLIILPHKEVDRGIPRGHSDPRNFDFNYFYQVLRENHNISIIPGITGITQERYSFPNHADMIENWPPRLSGRPERAAP